jgi:hypothetical protein
MKPEKPKKKDHFSEVAEKLIFIFGAIGAFILSVAWHGAKRVNFKSQDTWQVIVGVISGCYLCVYFDYLHLKILHWLAPSIFTKGFLYFFVTNVSDGTHFFLFVLFLLILISFIFGIFDYVITRRYQNKLNCIGFKNATGESPKIISHYATSEFATTLRIKSPGVGVDQYKAKKGDLETAFDGIIQHIGVSNNNRQIIEIGLTKKELPEIVHYYDCTSALKSPYSFVVGESLFGLIVQEIRKLPHLIISGTSGFGKSVLFNQVVISLLRSSRYIQIYLLDLKEGIGVHDFKDVPNIRIAKNEGEAVSILKVVKNEMMKRFKYLESKGYKTLDPVRDKKDIIVVGVDEASVLYTKEKNDKRKAENIKLARTLTDEIAKLGRAAGVHLILATQKVTTETIDTKVQENMGGKISFRASTLQGSNTVLGNKMAFELPEIKGRAIWSFGSKFIEVQTPLISDPELLEEVHILAEKFSKNSKNMFEEMLDPRKIEEKAELQEYLDVSAAIERADQDIA